MKLHVADLVDPSAVIPRLGSSDLRSALQEIAEGVASSYAGVDAARALRVLEQRDRLGTSGIGNGVAVPHARLAELDRIVGLVAVSPRGVDVRALDGQPARLFVALLSPARENVAHLEAMAAVARDMASARLRERLLAAGDAAEIYGVLRDAEFMTGL
jgi:PTS system nitrogen regulatory IIA component